LNTNYSDLAKLLTDLLYQSKNNGRPAATEIINTINGTDDENEIKNSLSMYKSVMGGLFNQYIKSPQELLGYTDNIKKNSEWGERIENEVANKLLSIPGYELLYQGGDGDFVDMVFSTDLIFKSPRNEVKTIQVKSSEAQAKAFIKDVSQGRHSAVDILIYPARDEFKIYSVKDGQTKSIKR
jgi:predicted AAA+ superfamily ATPase